jgi:uncharacterized RDD family membrane protein YckC
MKIASQGLRFVNLIVDNIFIQIVSAVVGFVVGMIYATSVLMANETITPEDESTLEVIGFIVGLVTALAYYALFEALFQRTPAKFITGTMVVNAEGERPSFGQCVGRSFARMIPFEAFSFLGSRNPVGWHDSLAGTRVIKAR